MKLLIFRKVSFHTLTTWFNCGTIYWGGYVDIKDGLYLFPVGEKFSVFGVYLCQTMDLGTKSAGELLIEFLDFDFAMISGIIKNANEFEGNKIFDEVGALDNDPITVLIKNLTNRKWIKAFELSPEGWQDEYSGSVGEILNSIISTHQKIWELADIYCESAGGTAEERFDFFHAVSELFTSMAVEEIISSRKPGKDFFGMPNENDYSFPYTRAYRFTDIDNYAQFIFMNMMQYDPTFSKCNYCYNFFIPKTKKLTRFCDRVDSESGKTCKEIAPTIYRNYDIKSNKILKQYDLALRRNYMRMCRCEDRSLGESAGKDLTAEEYFEWRDRVIKAMGLWKDKKILDRKLLEIVRELD